MVTKMEVKAAALTSQSALSHSALKLLKYESEIRSCKTVDQLIDHMVNQLTRMVSCDLVFCFHRLNKKNVKANAVNNLSGIDVSSPLINELNKWASQPERLEKIWKGRMSECFGLTNDLPGDFGYWAPLAFPSKSYKEYFFLVIRSDDVSDQQMLLLEHLSELYSNAFFAIEGASVVTRKKKALSRTVWLTGLTITAVLLGSVKMPLSVMAPVEVIPRDPFVVTAPFEGVVKKVSILPNTFVKKNEVLLSFEDVRWRNELALAQKNAAVYEARLDRLEGQSFSNADTTQEIAIARAELDLSLEQLAFAELRLSQTKVIAPVDGLVIYYDQQEMQGRKVIIGEQILKVADPKKVNYRIDLPVRQLLDFDFTQQVSIYLDTSPLNGNRAELISASYAPRVSSEGVASYTLVAKHSEGNIPAIGARGTARIYSSEAPLIWHLIRRPVNVIRQWMGL